MDETEGSENVERVMAESDVDRREAEEELGLVKGMEAPLRQRRWRMVNLRLQRQGANARRRWQTPPVVLYVIQKGKLMCKQMRESMQISRRPTNKINGRFGSSGVAVFSLSRDLLFMNLLLCVVLHVCLVIPTIIYSEDKGSHWTHDEWMWGWSTDFPNITPAPPPRPLSTTEPTVTSSATVKPHTMTSTSDIFPSDIATDTVPNTTFTDGSPHYHTSSSSPVSPTKAPPTPNVTAPLHPPSKSPVSPTKAPPTPNVTTSLHTPSKSPVSPTKAPPTPNATASLHSNYQDNHCLIFFLSKNDPQVVNCSMAYLDTLWYNNSTTGTLWLSEVLLGKGRLEFCPLFLGFYPAALTLKSNFPLYPLAAMQILAVLTTLLVSLVFVVRRVGQWLRYNSKVWGGLTFAKMVFTGWDYHLTEKHSISIKQQILTNSIRAALDEDTFQRSKVGRTRSQITTLYAKRLFVFCVVVAVLSACCGVIVVVTQHHQDISDWLESLDMVDYWDENISEFLVNFVDTLTVWVLGLVLPPLLSALGSLEQYSSRVTMLHFILRCAGVRLISIGTLVASQLIFAATSSSNNCTGDMPCWETVLGQKLYAQVIWDLLTRVVCKIVLFIYRFLTLPFTYFTRSLLPEFDVPGKVLDLLTLQTLSWLSVIVSPQLPLLIFISIYLTHFLEMFAAIFIYKPSKHVFQVAPSSAMFMVVLGVSWMGVAVFTACVLIFLPPSLGCGPFRGLDYPWNSLIQFLCNVAEPYTWIRDFLFTLDDWSVLGVSGLCLVFALLYYLHHVRVNNTVIRRLEERLLRISEARANLIAMQRLLGKKDPVSSPSLPPDTTISIV